MTSQHVPSKSTTQLITRGLRVFILLAMFSPLLAFLELSDQAEPAKFLVHSWGSAGFVILCLNLIVGSLWSLGFRQLAQRWSLQGVGAIFLQLRRQSGVISFAWLTAHAALLIVLEAGVVEAGQAIAQALYLQLAVAAWLSLSLLAGTSNNFSQRRLGKRWRKLHRLAYVAFALGWAHTLLIEKTDLIYFGAWGSAVVSLWLLRAIVSGVSRSRSNFPSRVTN